MSAIIMNGGGVSLALTVASARTTQLPAGRYLIRTLALGANVAWLVQGDVTVASTVNTAGETPFLDGGIEAEITVYNTAIDGYIAGIMSAGTGTLSVTPLDPRN